MPSRIQPERGGSAQDTDGMTTPDGRVVVNALWIMPHAIRIDEMSSALGNDFQHMPVNMIRDSRDQTGGSWP